MNRILQAASIILLASAAVALTGCNNDDTNVSAHDDCNCACRAPLIGRAECVPGPAPMVEAPSKAPAAPVAEVRPAVEVHPAVEARPAAPVRVERPEDVVYYRPSVPAHRERTGKMRTGEIESQ